MIYITKRTNNILRNPENLIYIAFISVFLHYVVTTLVIIALGVLLLVNPQTRRQVFSYKGRGWFLAFVGFTAVVAIMHRNFIGLACSIGFFFIIVISYYTRAVVTERLYDRCLDICCYAAIPLCIATVVENLLNSNISGYTCKLWFFNENYFCSVLAAIVIICGYNATSHKGPVLKYYVCAVFAGIALYLGESMFAFVEVFVGLCVLLILKRKHLMLSAMLMAVVICLIILSAVPDIFPRLSEINITSQRRIRIWNEAMPFIEENLLTGQGFLSYYKIGALHPDIYQTTHTHNFALEMLISFGLIGSVLLILFLWSYYRKVMECKELLRTNCATTLILTISTAVLVHMTTDLTVLWVQTGLLYGLILGGVGIDEDSLNKRIIACASLGGKSDIKNSPEKE